MDVQLQQDLVAAAAETGSARRRVLTCGAITADLSRHAIPERGEALLRAWAEQRDLAQAGRDLVAGAELNITEGRAALHSALRGTPVDTERARSACDEAIAARQPMLAFVEQVRSGEVRGLSGQRYTHFVNIGIGGSDLGPRLVVDALGNAEGPIQCEFLANVDGHALHRLLPRLNPETTLFGVISKSFGTRETLLNAQSARRWLASELGVSEQEAGGQFVTVSANVERASEFGIARDRVFPMFDWVGGRYSLWSNVGIAIAMSLGRDGFEQLLAGAAAVDQHFVTAPLEENLPMQLALLGAWYRNARGLQAYTVVSYDQRLQLLGEYLQQLDMESNGKRVDREGQLCEYPTGPAIFGGVGTLGQHAYFQWLHQGTTPIPVDLIGVVRPDHPYQEHHRELLANLAGQAWALHTGRDADATAAALNAAGQSADRAPHCTFPGGRGVSVLLLDRLTPNTLGSLLAVYEHKVFAQGWLWNINSFDQWGVELGKTLAKRVEPLLAGGDLPDDVDPITARLIELLRTDEPLSGLRQNDSHG